MEFTIWVNTFMMSILRITLFIVAIQFFVLLSSAVYSKSNTDITSDILTIEEEGNFSAFDFYVGGNYFGLIYGYFNNGWFKLEMPEDAISLLPPVKNKNAFLTLFQGKIKQEKIIDNIGKLNINFDNFQIFLEIASEQSLVDAISEFKDLPEGEKTLSIRNEILTVGSTSLNESFDIKNVTLNHDTLFSRGPSSFKSAGSLSDTAGYELTDASLRHDFKAKDHNLTMAAGILQSNGLHFARSLDFYGMRLGTNNRLLFRDPLLQASYIEIFLPTRKRVEIFRESESSGRIIFSKIMNFGTIQIDTRSFPLGSYDIEIVTTSNDGTVEREIRPFTKSRRLSPHGKPEFNLEIGTTRDGLDITGKTLGLLSYKKRLTDWADTKIAVVITDDDAVLETEINTENKIELLGFSGLLETSIIGAIDSNGDPAGIEGSLLLRGDKRSLRLLATQSFNRPERNTNQDSLVTSGRKSFNTNFSTPFSLWGKYGRLNLNGQWSNTDSSGSSHRYGPEIILHLQKSNNTETDLKVNLLKTDNDDQATISLNWRRNKDVWQQQGDIVALATGSESRTSSSGLLSFQGSEGKYKDWRQNLQGTMNLRLDPLSSNEGQKTTLITNTNGEYKGKWARIQGFVDNNFRTNSGRMGGEISSTILWTSDGGLRTSSEKLHDDSALLAVKIKGNNSKSLVGISLNGSPRVYGYPGETLYMTLPTYVTSRISAFDAGDEGVISILEKPYDITALPGNVFIKEFNTAQLIFTLGQLFDGNGVALANKRIKLSGEYFYTDEDGYFDLEVPYQNNKKIEISTKSLACEFTLGDIEENQIIMEVGKIICSNKEKPLK